ncbi:auxin-responsive protein IAA2-like [Tripterygium wilfordii]|uniref:auxin-responsive protein IAA2-like n=1 Tax=Tripterygium wilfordii TaxID=458696 RepID=UPI0018F84088|nr:auxin-responsive protein IAA2-like [Tripterygium wilfordii]
MDCCSNNGKACPNLIDLIPKERVWLVKRDEKRVHGSSEEKNLELKLGPPGVQDWSRKNSSRNSNKERENEKSINLSLGYFSSMTNNNNNGNLTHKFSSSENLSSPWSTKGSFLQFPSTTQQSLPVMVKESSQSQPCCTKVVELQSAENKAFSPVPANTAVPNSSQKRSAPGPVVGWPPIRSFRRNLASSSSSKASPDPQNGVPSKKIASEKQVESCNKGLFVKINMDGIPIGRKVDLKAYDSYEKLSKAVDELFGGLLAAQKDSSATGIMNTEEEEKPITGILEGSGEYTLVYEDNEGDRMLVGDVPWHMFVSMVKRLRVLKSSDVSSLSLASGKLDRRTKMDSAALK